MGDQKDNFCASKDSESSFSNDCENENRATNNVREHSQTNADEGSFTCDTCKRSFLQNEDLKKHSEVHLPFLCPFCQEGFSSIALLKKHERNHSGPFICNVCDKEFSLKGNLKSHLHVHSDKKPYVCAFCNAGFNQMYCLKKHSEIHSVIPVDELCSKSFFESHLKGHSNPPKRDHKKVAKPFFWDTLRKGFSKSYLKERRQAMGKKGNL